MHYHTETELNGFSENSPQMRNADPCRMAAHLTEGNNVLITVALKFGGLKRFPRILLGDPCFSIVNDVNLPKNLLEKICDGKNKTLIVSLGGLALSRSARVVLLLDEITIVPTLSEFNVLFSIRFRFHLKRLLPQFAILNNKST